MSRFAIILAAGSGKRLGLDLPKQFRTLGSLPMLVHSLLAFHQADKKIKLYVVLPKQHVGEWRKLKHEFSLPLDYSIVEGGSERFHSVKNALSEIGEKDGWVAVHDAARPFASSALIKRMYKEAEEYGCSIPSIPVPDSLRFFDGQSWRVTDRNLHRLVQTPQVFLLKKLREAYNVDFQSSFTDDASVYEHEGNSIHLAEGEVGNIKITTAIDMEIAQLRAENRK